MERPHRHSDTDEDYNSDTTTLVPSSFEQVPDDVMFHIFSFVSLPSLENIPLHYYNPLQPFKIVSRLNDTIGLASKFFKEKVNEYVTRTPIEYWLKHRGTGKMCYYQLAWLCKNQIKIGALGANYTVWNYVNVSSFIYMLQQCDLTHLVEVTMDFRHFGESPPNDESLLATEAGIPQKVVNRMRNTLMFDQDIRLIVQRQFFQIIVDRAKKLTELSISGIVTKGGGDFDLEFLMSQLVKLPLRRLDLDLNNEYNELPLPEYDVQDDLPILSEGIESFNTLKTLTLRIPGDCEIRSTSLSELDYYGQNDLVQCKCPLLESMSFIIYRYGDLQRVSSSFHSVKKLDLRFDSDGSAVDTEYLAEIIYAMTTLEELSISVSFDPEIRVTPNPLHIQSESLQRITLGSFGDVVHVSSCICPKLEMIECYETYPMQRPCCLVPVDDGLLRSLMTTSCIDNEEKKVFLFRDCPFTGFEVPDDCQIKIYI